MVVCGEDLYDEPVKRKKKLKKRGHPKKDRTKIMTCKKEGIYRVRIDKDGTHWHSRVDPNRPDSPILEFPQHPDTENADGTSTLFGTPDEEDERAVRKEMDSFMAFVRQEQAKKDAKKEAKKLSLEPEDEGDKYIDFQPLDAQLDDPFSSVQLENFPGLHPEDKGTFSPIGGTGGHEYDEY